MVIGRMREIAKGRAVYTSDGAKLGKVKDLELNAVEVENPSQPDYWLPMSCVVAVRDGGLRLGFAKRSLDEFKLDSATEPADGVTMPIVEDP
jgi:hypothetical protein